MSLNEKKDIGSLADYHVYYRLGLGGQLIFNIPELNMIIVTGDNKESVAAIITIH